MKVIKELNKELVLTPVSTEGYTTRDIASYYGNTFLLWASEGVHKVVYVRDTTALTMVCSVLGGEGLLQVEVCMSELFRFTPLQGFYDFRKSLLAYRLPTTRSYKKGINRELLRLSAQVNEERTITSLNPQLECLTAICSAPQGSFLKGSRVLSRRLGIHEGKIYSFYQSKTVGSYRDGVLSTPFISIIDRVSQLGGDIKCQLHAL